MPRSWPTLLIAPTIPTGFPLSPKGERQGLCPIPLENGGGLFQNRRTMEKRLKRETAKLKKSWMQYDQAMLRDYLVEQVEDPRLNVQSILSRHFLIEGLF